METITNNCTINIATANGTGSQSANLIILQTLFDMGVNVSGKNFFPSNISGLPTWYVIRVSEKGYQAPGDGVNIQILMNKATWMKDLESLEPGSVIIYNSDVKLPVERDDCILYPIPMTKMARTIHPKLARMISNVIYVGVLAEILNLDQEIIELAVSKQFKGKDSAIQLNLNAANLGKEYFQENFKKQDPYVIEDRGKDDDAFLIEGNEAIALGAIYGGVSLLAWYPITPSSSVAESIIEWVPKLRLDKDGKSTCAIIQAEDEIAAAGMIIGGGWAGGRTMTATSGPGISLMSEFIGLSYFAEIPCVIWDVNRTGPSTGLPTRTQQGDLTLLYEASHGDTQHIVIIPGTVEECFEFGWRAFDYAEQFQTLVFGFSDLDLGMNKWKATNLEYPTEKMNRGKVIHTQEQLEKISNFGRYRDVDGDGIPYRTLPGSGLAPILYRGTGHDEDGVYSEDPEVYRNMMMRLRKKIDSARTILPQPLFREEVEQEVGIIYYGSMETTIQEIDDLLEDTGMKVSQCRVRSLPLSPAVEKFVENHELIIVLEINRDGQMYGILRKELPIELVPKVHSVAYSDGLPPRGNVYAEKILQKIKDVKK